MLLPHWKLRQSTEIEDTICSHLSAELSISKLEAMLLVHRGLHTPEEARAFVRPLISELHDPFLMRDMDKAVSRLHKAIESGEHILIYGDYDVDGTTAVALVYSFLSRLESFQGEKKERLHYYIPDRHNEGYGISFQGIDYAIENACTLIIALDCGIRSIEKVKYAKERNIDFIICDHHLPESSIPNAIAVLDTKRQDNTYPFDELCGCGVGFKFMQAYAQHIGMGLEHLEPLLEFVAMAIASDIVPVIGENRILAYHGVRRINKAPSVGLRSLLRVTGLERGTITFTDLIYKIGPRINACGRLKSGREAVKLLITEIPREAEQISTDINQNNEERKFLDRDITEAALAMLSQDPENATKTASVVCGKEWHKGVIGIVASRLTEHWYRPTIVLTEKDGIASGSARSVGGFDIYSAIDSCSDLLTHFGGHTFAAGLSMKIENLPLFKERFEAYTLAHIKPEQQHPVIEVEAEIRFADITPSLSKLLRALEPFGPGNPNPIFVTRDIHDFRYTRSVGNEKQHLHLNVTDDTGPAMDGIMFGQGHIAENLTKGQHADLCYELRPHTYKGRTTMQIFAQDIRLLP